MCFAGSGTARVGAPAGLPVSGDRGATDVAYILMLAGGGLLVSIAAFYRSDSRRGFYPLLGVLLLDAII